MIGIGLGIRVGKGASGAVAPDGNPSALVATVISDVRIDLSWTNGATNQDGTEVFISTDGTNYASKGTTIGSGTTFSATSLIADTLYYFKVAHYKGSNYSNYSNIDSEYAGFWYLAGGLTASDVVGAYKAVGAASQADSYKNLISPGTGDLTANGAVSWNKTQGWGNFNYTPSAIYLTGPAYKTKTYSIVVLVYNGSLANAGRAVSAEPDLSGSLGMFVIPVSTATLGAIRNGNYAINPSSKGRGVFGANQAVAYVDGAKVADLVPSGSENTVNIRIGLNSAGGAAYFAGTVMAIAIYNKSITEAQLAAVQNRMKVDHFVVKNIRSFASALRYVGNPIINYNTNAYNTYGADTPYFRIENKIGDVYHAITQASTSFGIWRNLLHYTSTDLINWSLHATNPIISREVGAFDAELLLHPDVLKIGSTWHCYYSGKDAATKETIGLATSEDFVTWTKYASNPVYSPPSGSACIPSVVKRGENDYVMYYHNRQDANVGLIFYATSTDGYTWTYGGQCFRIVRGEVTYNWYVFDPWVIKRSDGIYEMIMSRAKYVGGVDQDFVYAVSYDGVNFYMKNEVVFENSGVGGEAGYIGDPVLLEKEDGSCYLYYSGMNKNDGTENSDGRVAII